MITVIDNFLPTEVFQAAHTETKNCDFNPITSKMQKEGFQWPGVRSSALKTINPLLDASITSALVSFYLPFTNRPFNYTQFAHLRVEKDNESDFIHTDIGDDFAWLLYMSETNLDSGTKFYTEDDYEHNFVRFVQNRFIIFDCRIKHMAFNNYGKDFNDGRLTINGFASYSMEKK